MLHAPLISTLPRFHSDNIKSKVKLKWSRYRPGVAQRVGRGIALLFHDRSTRRGWVVSSTPRPHFKTGKDRVPILQEAGWAPGLVRTGGKFRPHLDSIPDRPAHSQSLYRLSYRAHQWNVQTWILLINMFFLFPCTFSSWYFCNFCLSLFRRYVQVPPLV